MRKRLTPGVQVAEEKGEKLLIALLQTPIHEIQWLIAKLITGMVLIVTAVLFLHLLGRFGPVHLFSYCLVILVGSYCCSAFGIFLGFSAAPAAFGAVRRFARIDRRRTFPSFVRIVQVAAIHTPGRGQDGGHDF